MIFQHFTDAVNSQFGKLAKQELFFVDLDKDALYQLYLSSFPAGTNPTFRERSEHDCTACRQFIRNAGNVVAFINDKIVSVWDIDSTKVDPAYAAVAESLSAFVKQHTISGPYRYEMPQVGVKFNFDSKTNEKWHHFNFELPRQFVMKNTDYPSFLGERRTDKDLLERSLKEITTDAVDTVHDLIKQNSIYRGQEHLHTVEALKKLQKEFNKLPADQQQMFLWKKSLELKHAGRFKNTVIGTLLHDLSTGTDLEIAVKMFESKVAPQHYKRSSALITDKMIKQAEQTVNELGIEPSFHRRFAVAADIKVPDVIFADRSIQPQMKDGLFGDLKTSKPTSTQSFDKVEEVTIERFINDIVPNATSIELFVENTHTNNFVSIIAPVYNDSPNIFKWNNNFSWSYNGEVTDSIKEKVKKAGGNVNGFVRASLSWFNHDDLDLHMYQPNGDTLYYANGKHYPLQSSGVLDVDMNAGGGTTREPVENIVYTNPNKMPDGDYTVFVNQFSKREMKDVGFIVELDLNGTVHTFHYDKPVSGKIKVATFNYNKSTHQLSLKDAIDSSISSKQMWNLNTQQFHKVSMIMLSPNHWHDNTIKQGNLHYFFIIDKCINPDQARGFYNEFLNNDLNTHRKVFEVLSSKLKTIESNDQLSGLGFSSTQHNTIIARISGSFNRTIKVKF